MIHFNWRGESIAYRGAFTYQQCGQSSINIEKCLTKWELNLLCWIPTFWTFLRCINCYFAILETVRHVAHPPPPGSTVEWSAPRATATPVQSARDTKMALRGRDCASLLTCLCSASCCRLNTSLDKYASMRVTADVTRTIKVKLSLIVFSSALSMSRLITSKALIWAVGPAGGSDTQEL